MRRVYPPPPQILHNHCFPFLLGITVVRREIEDNGYAILFFGGGTGGGGGGEGERTLNDWSRGKQLENIEIWGKQNLMKGPVFKQFVI